MSGHPLDQPVWSCLTGRQARLTHGGGAALRIDPAYGPFGAARDARGDKPYLHSYAHNTGAIRLYEALGFRARRTMTLTVLVRA